MKSFNQNQIKFIKENEEKIEECLEKNKIFDLNRLEGANYLSAQELISIQYSLVFLVSPDSFEFYGEPYSGFRLELRNVFYNNTQNQMITAKGSPLLPAMFKNHSKVLLLKLNKKFEILKKENYVLSTKEDYTNKLQSEGYNLVLEETKYNMDQLKDLKVPFSFELRAGGLADNFLFSSKLNCVITDDFDDISSVTLKVKEELLKCYNSRYWLDKLALKIVNNLVTEDSVREIVNG